MLYLRSLRSLVAVSVVSVTVWFVAAGGCTSPVRNMTGTAGTGSPGTAGTGSPGTAGTSATGTAGDNGVGAGGQGNEIIIVTTGTAGSGGTSSTGSAGSATTGTAGNGTSGSAGASGAGGSATKLACPSATTDPLLYTSGYTPNSTVHSMAMSMATGLTDTEK